MIEERFWTHSRVGRLRRLLMVRGSHRWNAWIRDLTARLG
jgi:hypothetical protein